MNRNHPTNIAIYYSKQRWTQLLKDCLAPLIQSLEKEGICNKYVLYFSEEQGEHIRLVLYLQEIASHMTSTYLAHIQRFLDTHPTQQPAKSLPFHDSFFLDLPNNRVYVNSFKRSFPYTTQLDSLQITSIRKEISSLMLDAFADNLVNRESLFNFYLCLEVVALAVFGNLLNAAKVLKADYEELAARLPAAGLIRLEYEADKLIKNNRADLDQMLALIIHGHYTAETEWLITWFKVCNQMAKAIEPLRLFRDISMLICQHINFYHAKWSALGLVTLNRLLSNQNKSIHCTT